MRLKHILEKFKFEVVDLPLTIYPYAPVYKVTQEDKTFIVKKTINDIEQARNLAKFLQMLKFKEVNIVAPVNILAENPAQIEDDIWVVYPFIEGTKYTAKKNEILNAGRLLGKIHSLSSNTNQEQLEIYDEFDFQLSDLLDDLNTIQDSIEHTDFEKLKIQVAKILAQQQKIKIAHLPTVATPYDYKADNLVYLDESNPYLIDPDNAIFLPRIFDLALALLLFHNVLETAPHRMFTVDEWNLFKQGYAEFVTLTDLEKEYWFIAIEHIFVDEVIWLMADFSEGWKMQHQLGIYSSIFKCILTPSLLQQYDLEINT